MINILESRKLTPRDLIEAYDPYETNISKVNQIRILLRRQSREFSIELLEISENMGLSILTRAFESKEIREIYIQFLTEKRYAISIEKHNEEISEIKAAARRAGEEIEKHLKWKDRSGKEYAENIKEDYEDEIRNLNAIHQDNINRMQRGHAIEVQALKAKLYDLEQAAKKDF